MGGHEIKTGSHVGSGENGSERHEGGFKGARDSIASERIFEEDKE